MPKEEEKSSADNPVCDTSACTVLAKGIKNLKLLVKKKPTNKEGASEWHSTVHTTVSTALQCNSLWSMHFHKVLNSIWHKTVTDQIIPLYTMLQDVMFSYQMYWKFKSPGLWCVLLGYNTLIKSHHNIPEDMHRQHTVFLEQMTGIQMIKKSLSVLHHAHKPTNGSYLQPPSCNVYMHYFS